MRVSIESEGALREALDGLAHEKESLFNGGYEEGTDEELYQGLVGAHDALMTVRLRLRYQEALKRLESIEAGCKKRLKTEYREKFDGCVAFLSAEIGKMYVALIEKSRGEGDVRRWLEALKSLYIK